MTGTALENRLAEMHTLVAAAQPELQDLLKQLLWQVRPKPNEIRRQLAPVYLRRTQADVLNELPDLVHNDEIIPLEPADRQAYESAPVHLMQRRLAATIGQGGLNSAKYDRLKQLLESYEDEGRKVAIFSTFLQVLSDVSELSGRCPVIHGGVATEERQKMIDAFTAKQGFAVLALQIDAGGLGINLQSAQVVVLMEPQFKPSTEKQAVARVRRMGQTRKVHAHRLIAQGTVDEALVALVEAKTKIFEDYAQHSAVKSASRMAVDGASGALLEQLKAEVGRTG
jgi:SNF2 family DNA or RNA helicase